MPLPSGRSRNASWSSSGRSQSSGLRRRPEKSPGAWESPQIRPSTYRRRLIDRGLISPAGHGLVDIEVPYLAAYLRDHAED